MIDPTAKAEFDRENKIARLQRGQCPQCHGSRNSFLPDPKCPVCHGRPLTVSQIDRLLESVIAEPT